MVPKREGSQCTETKGCGGRYAVDLECRVCHPDNKPKLKTVVDSGGVTQAVNGPTPTDVEPAHGDEFVLSAEGAQKAGGAKPRPLPILGIGGGALGGN